MTDLRLSLGVRITFGAMAGLVAGPVVLVQAGALDATAVLASLPIGAFVGAMAVYFHHRFRRYAPMKRWSATGGAVGVLLAALGVDLLDAPLWAIPAGGLTGAGLASWLLWYDRLYQRRLLRRAGLDPDATEERRPELWPSQRDDA